jgi:predicted  nucleic acid-binding Zn-ribbon protein
MAFMTNREFAELEFRRQKRNEYTEALMREVERLREENTELKAERDALKKSIAKGVVK